MQTPTTWQTAKVHIIYVQNAPTWTRDKNFFSQSLRCSRLLPLSIASAAHFQYRSMRLKCSSLDFNWKSPCGGLSSSNIWMENELSNGFYFAYAKTENFATWKRHESAANCRQIGVVWHPPLSLISILVSHYISKCEDEIS